MRWSNLYRGVFMAISDLIPGVSGGTIAFILGIYDELLESISGIFSRNWKKHIGFLLPLGIGVVITLLLFSKVIEYLLENHAIPTQFFFIGLIIGVIPFIAKQSEMKKYFKAKHFFIMFIVGVALASFAFVSPQDTTPMTELTTSNVLGLFFSGWLGSMAMLLPGISGSFILLLLGVYSTAIAALSNLNFSIIAVIGAGVVVGFIVSSKAISYLLKNFKLIMFAVIMGLILGSIFVVYPGLPSNGMMFVISIGTFIAGLLIAKVFSSPQAT
ncbi:DUF368 domain-containing protein [Sporosarcina sp. CAU 1771]